MPNPLIVSASNDAYLDLLDGMLGSIGGRLADFDLGIIDLGLSDAGKDRIRARKTGVHFARAEWRRTFPGIDKAPEYKKVFVSKPFIPDIFPGYENYVWVDADIWFQDAGAIDDYVEAGNTRGGAAFGFESHPTYLPQRVRRLEIFGKVFVKGVKSYFLSRTREMFGSRIAAEVGIPPILNSGLFHMAGGSPIWRAWQETLLAANLKRRHRRAQICDQTCLQVALIRRELPHAVMPAAYNWLPLMSAPLIDAATFALLDPAWPHPPIKAVHLVGVKDPGKGEIELPVTDGRRIRTSLEWADFQRLRADDIGAGR